MDKVIAQKDKVVQQLRLENYDYVIKSLENVTLFEGKAQFISDNEIKIDGITLIGNKFIIATGSSPKILPIKGIESVEYLTYNEALNLRQVPSSLIVLGGGSLALEFAQMFHRFGSHVTLLQRSPRVLSKEEPEISMEIQRNYRGICQTKGSTLSQEQVLRNCPKIMGIRLSKYWWMGKSGNSKEKHC